MLAKCLQSSPSADLCEMQLVNSSHTCLPFTLSLSRSYMMPLFSTQILLLRFSLFHNHYRWLINILCQMLRDMRGAGGAAGAGSGHRFRLAQLVLNAVALLAITVALFAYFRANPAVQVTTPYTLTYSFHSSIQNWLKLNSIYEFIQLDMKTIVLKRLVVGLSSLLFIEFHRVKWLFYKPHRRVGAWTVTSDTRK